MKQIIKSFVPTIFLLMIGLWFSQNAHASPANQKSPLAINVAGIQRWNTDWPLIDEMKRAEVVTQCAGGDCLIWNTQEHHKVAWDENGWPRTLTPKGDEGGQFTKISYLLFGGAYERWDVPPPPTGKFHVLYEGEGTLEYDGEIAKKVESCGERCDIVKIETPEDANDVARISIIETDPNNNGKYLKNIQVIWPGGLCNGDVFTYHASADSCTGTGTDTYQSFVELKDQITFHPDYLKDLKRYKAIRFMNFQAANETITTRYDESIGDWGAWVVDVNEETRWAARRLPSYSVWSDGIPVSTGKYPPNRGVPIEVMIELLNVLGADGWFSVPFAATDNYVQQFAQTVKEKLTKGQKIYLEYGNEAWNSSFRGAKWLEAKGAAFWPDTGTVFDKQMNWFAKRTTEICKLWKGEWSGDSDRVECVMGGWAAVKSVTEHLILDCFLWKNDARNPQKGTCASQVDAVAIAPYFGGYIGDLSYREQIKGWDETKLFTEITQGDQLTVAAEVLGIPASPSRYPSVNSDERPEQNQIPVQEVISVQAELLPEAQASAEATSVGALAEAQGWMSDQAKLARDYGVDLLAYEGGQHLVGINYPPSYPDSEDKVINDKITQLFRDTNRDPRMGSAYTRHLNDWKQVGGKLFAVFDAVGPSSQSGSWGIKEYQNQLSPPKHAAVQQFITDENCWWPGCDEGGVISYTLPDNQWQQIGLPRKLPEGQNTVAEVFGDDLGESGYNENWAVYSYDTVKGSYANPGLDGVLQQGVGYWIIQKSGVNATLSLPFRSTATPVTTPTQCPSDNGCFEIPLITKQGAVGWNMLAHVFESDVRPNELRIVTNDSPCNDADGCTLDEAEAAGIVHNQFWRYDGASYQQLEARDVIKSWYGLWVATLDQADGLELKLLIPKL